MADISQMGDLSQIPATQPPPGITPNFEDPPSLATVYRVSVYLFVPLTFLFVVVRVYARAILMNRFGTDDVLAILSAAIITSYCATVIKLVDHPLGRHLWDVPLSEINNEYLKLTAVGLALYCLGAMFFKLTLLSLYLRLFNPVRLAFFLICGGMAAVVGVYVSLAIFMLDKCVPRSGQTWQYTTFYGSCSTAQDTISKVSGIFGLISDIYILLIPLWLISHLTLAPKRKAGVLAIFLTGLVGIGSSAAGLATRYIWDQADGTWAIVYALGIIESNIGIICACMPVVVLPLKAAMSRVVTTWNTIKSYTRTRNTTASHTENAATDVEVAGLKEHHDHLSLAHRGTGTITGLRSFIHKAYRSATFSTKPSGSTTVNTGTFATLESVDVDADYHKQLLTIHRDGNPSSQSS
ncbi:hypothetical protein F4777DRAFT_572996 [Nemania sp. FL0916]|nr:hypothetical protein F4777DRAFT_572996 [Nemania sp. FL0916]